MLQAILIANRGEVAIRIIRACRESDIRSIAVYSDADAQALHVRLADEAYCLGPAPPQLSYLNVEKILALARQSGAEAVHPGYGLLSENADFAAAVVSAGLIFIGPSTDMIATMGDKIAAREVARNCGIPLLPGSDGAVTDTAKARQLASDITYPLLIKACFGGGGRGMRIVQEEAGLLAALEEAGRESASAFGRAEVYLERYLPRARHVEVQVLGDQQGNIVHIGDRDCSVQRRHQKLIEEAPAPGLSVTLREKMATAAMQLASSINYYSTGTIEFLLDPNSGSFYFLEMNTRLQVEHGVSEMISGIDLVQWQIRIAAGQPLDFNQDQVTLSGHAIEARIAAEDPWHGFQPCPGTIENLALPSGPWLRLDFSVESGDNIPAYYDSMFGKLQAWGRSRESARRRLVSALQTLRVAGIPTTAPYLLQVLEQSDFIDVTHDTASVESSWQPDPEQGPGATVFANESTAAQPVSERRVNLSTTQGVIEISIFARGLAARVDQPGANSRNINTKEANTRIAGEAVAPMDSAVIKIPVKTGEQVDKGDVLVILEAMKMELQIVSPRAGVVEKIMVNPGDMVLRNSLLIKLSTAV